MAVLTNEHLSVAIEGKVKVRGIPHLAKNERDMGHPGAVAGGGF
jgi:hypothetical protein